MLNMNYNLLYLNGIQYSIKEAALHSSSIWIVLLKPKLYVHILKFYPPIPLDIDSIFDKLNKIKQWTRGPLKPESFINFHWSVIPQDQIVNINLWAGETVSKVKKAMQNQESLEVEKGSYA